ncbi:MAG: hypothetical protein KAT61_07690 [Gammaproteobacteria bacterium]|nr:hypothetical protein [Gammaproteobacteria bacterium]
MSHAAILPNTSLRVKRQLMLVLHGHGFSLLLQPDSFQINVNIYPDATS